MESPVREPGLAAQNYSAAPVVPAAPIFLAVPFLVVLAVPVSPACPVDRRRSAGLAGFHCFVRFQRRFSYVRAVPASARPGPGPIRDPGRPALADSCRSG